MNPKHQAKLDRCEKANELIRLIGTSGRQFFNYKDRTDRNGCMSHFIVRDNGYVYYVDGFTKKPIYAYAPRFFKSRYFSEGGTIQALMLDLSLYIRTGEITNGKNGYGGIYCPHWGYPEDDMVKIHAKAVEIGFARQRNIPNN